MSAGWGRWGEAGRGGSCLVSVAGQTGESGVGETVSVAYDNSSGTRQPRGQKTVSCLVAATTSEVLAATAARCQAWCDVVLFNKCFVFLTPREDFTP